MPGPGESAGLPPRGTCAVPARFACGRTMRRNRGRNDLWDWGVILLLVACATAFLWAGVWAIHSWAATASVVVANPHLAF